MYAGIAVVYPAGTEILRHYIYVLYNCCVRSSEVFDNGCVSVIPTLRIN